MSKHLWEISPNFAYDENSIDDWTLVESWKEFKDKYSELDLLDENPLLYWAWYPDGYLYLMWNHLQTCQPIVFQIRVKKTQEKTIRTYISKNQFTKL
jgi:hypothetical protein